jgi:predicted small secreted protein
MRKNILTLILVATVAFSTTSCYTTLSNIGSGSKTGVTVSKKQWYLIGGLVPLNEVDAGKLAGDAKDYTIKTQHSFIDLLVGVILSNIVTVQTISVIK